MAPGLPDIKMVRLAVEHGFRRADGRSATSEEGQMKRTLILVRHGKPSWGAGQPGGSGAPWLHGAARCP